MATGNETGGRESAMEQTPEKVRPTARLGAHEGRLKGDYAREQVEYFYAPLVEKMKFLFHPIMKYNKAHVVMLTEREIVDPERARKILIALAEIEDLGVESIDLDPKLQGIYPNVEALLIDKVGYNVGGMLYIGRTRGDAQKVPERMSHREALLSIMDEVIGVRRAALKLAADNVDTIMPSYTHLQHAQPMTFGFYMLSFIDAMEADFERLVDGYKRVNMSSAEIGAGMTTSFPVSRERVAELLGYEGIIENGLYCHRSLDRELEILAALAILTVDVYRLCEDFHVWCASDINFMELDDEFSATSFMMAQKKNPTGLAHPELVAITTHQTFNIFHDFSKRNTSEVSLKGSQSYAFRHEAMGQIIGALKSMKGILSTVILHKEVMEQSVGRLFSQGTDLTDALVRESGLSFREGHRVVGTLVRSALDQGKNPNHVTTDMVKQAAKDALGKAIEFKEESLKKVLDPMEGIRAKKIFGGTAPEIVKESIERKNRTVDEHKRWIQAKRKALAAADQKLTRACEAIVGAA
jgi:argininosuccinate lyase